jgi:hypothetical protein
MSGAQQATFMNQRAFGPPPEPPPTTIGQAYGGGFYAGLIGVGGVATHYLVVAPLASGYSPLRLFKPTDTATSGATSLVDGPANTAALVSQGSHPAAEFCNNLVIGGYSDWYLPATNELEVCYRALKPTTANNVTNSGANVNAVPTTGNYTTANPPQTSVLIFRSGGAQAYPTTSGTNYWTSTTLGATNAQQRAFANGSTDARRKSVNFKVRAIRRVPV